jgi:hypothetical protein
MEWIPLSRRGVTPADDTFFLLLMPSSTFRHLSLPQSPPLLVTFSLDASPTGRPSSSVHRQKPYIARFVTGCRYPRRLQTLTLIVGVAVTVIDANPLPWRICHCLTPPAQPNPDSATTSRPLLHPDPLLPIQYDADFLLVQIRAPSCGGSLPSFSEMEWGCAWM